MDSNEVEGTMVCECGEVFELRELDDAADFGRMLDEHVQTVHRGLMATTDFPHT
jgi:hypothetical protein